MRLKIRIGQLLTLSLIKHPRLLPNLHRGLLMGLYDLQRLGKRQRCIVRQIILGDVELRQRLIRRNRAGNCAAAAVTEIILPHGKSFERLVELCVDAESKALMC